MTLKDRKSLSHLTNLPLGSVLLLTKRKYTKIPPMIDKMLAIMSQIPTPAAVSAAEL